MLVRQQAEYTSLMQALGCIVVRAPDGYDGEGVCAALCILGYCNTVLSNDGDAVVFGAKHLLTNVEFTPEGVKQLTVLDIAPLRARLGLCDSAPLTEALQVFARQTGNDYGPGAENVGAVGAERVLRAVLAPHPTGGLTDAGALERMRLRLEVPSGDEMVRDRCFIRFKPWPRSSAPRDQL